MADELDVDPEQKPAKKPTPQPPRQGGLLLVLLLGMIAGLGACVFVMSHARHGASIAHSFNAELNGIATLYLQYSSVAFVMPPLIWLAAMVVTRGARTQLNVGNMLAILLFGFALLWSMGAFVAFQRAYDPPRSERLR